MTECAERMTHTEVSSVVDQQNGVKAIVESLEKRSKLLENKMTDMEMRS